MEASTYHCYLIESDNSAYNATYVGVTNSLERRIRQHNGEITGGAKYTARRRPWKYVLCVGPFHEYRHALQFEWAWKHAAPKRVRGMKGRIIKLAAVLSKDRCTRNAPLFSDLPPLIVSVLGELAETTRELLDAKLCPLIYEGKCELSDVVR